MSISGLITCLICATALTLAAASSKAQSALDKKISISIRNQTLENALDQVSKAAAITISYGDNRALEEHLSINAQNEKLSLILDKILAGKPFAYISLDDKILIRYTPEKLNPKPGTLNGKVTDEKGQPLPGATIKVKNTNISTQTDQDGNFHLPNLDKNAILTITFIGYQTQEIPAGDNTNLTITLQLSSSKLDEVVIIPYGTTTERLNTGSIGKVTASDIAQQPITNPLAALEGKIPGLVISQTNGIPGSKFNILLRGQNALSTDRFASSDPLFIIDGIPFGPNNTSINQIGSSVGQNGLSPFNSINPNDIESIEVLKDADATSIYGSRGAYGVILITTKKGKAGKTTVTANVYSGLSSVTNMQKLLSTEQYLNLRKEAFANDGITPSVTNAADLLIYDQQKETDWQKYFIGNTAHISDVQTSISGGNERTQFLISGDYHFESTVFPGSQGDNRIAFHSNLSHTSENKRLSLTLSTSYSNDRNRLLVGDLTSYTYLSPNYPDLIDGNGNLVWTVGGSTITNPMSYSKYDYLANTNNLITNLLVNYKLLPHLTLKASAGYNKLRLDETFLQPSTTSAPQFNPTGSSQFGGNDFSSWILEPQIEYQHSIAKGKINALVGATWQENENNSSYVQGLGYTSDYLLRSLSAASSLSSTNDYSLYRYSALFGRLNYNFEDTYLLNITGRRDGSSRFGEGKQFANFGAIGAAWIFTNENLFKDKMSILSFGKLRGSYGITGSDMIGNYQYLDSWTNATSPYQGSTGIIPARLANKNYGWESNTKLEAAIDLGFLQDKFLLSAAYYRTISGNHLINYKLPSQTGFQSIIENFPAIVRNTGWEFSLNSKIITGMKFTWTSVWNITIPQNKLVSFPGLETSSYSSVYIVGQSLSVVRGLEYIGVNPATGVFQFKDQNNDGNYDAQDQIIIGKTDPDFYGGFLNSFTYKRLSLNVFFEFKKQMGQNYFANINNTAVSLPGYSFNVPNALLGRWQKAGDIAAYQKLTTTSGTAAFNASNLLYNYNSNFSFTDASYIRLKNVYCSFDLPESLIKKAHLNNLKIFFQGQNLFTITGYKGVDPETMNYYTLPPLKTFSFGLQVTL